MEDSPVLPDDAVGQLSDVQFSTSSDEIAKIRSDFEGRLIMAGLRTEAVHAGMVDLDGLKLIEVSGIQLDADDNVLDGKKIMEQLRRNKPWLFAGRSSSNIKAAPASQPVRQKTALEMTDEEYAVARSVLTKFEF